MKRHICVLLLCCTLFAGCKEAGPLEGELPLGDADDHNIFGNTLEERQPTQNVEQSEAAEMERSSMEAEPATDNLEAVYPDAVDFMDGPGGASTVSLAVGDSFLGFTMTDLEWTLTEGDFIATFTGEATLRGRLSRNGEDAILGTLVSFAVSDNDVHLLPYHTRDERNVWFGIRDDELVQASVGDETVYDYPCEVVISSYEIHFRQMMVWNGAKVKELRLLDA